MRRSLPALALLILGATGCDDLASRAEGVVDGIGERIAGLTADDTSQESSQPAPAPQTEDGAPSNALHMAKTNRVALPVSERVIHDSVPTDEPAAAAAPPRPSEPAVAKPANTERTPTPPVATGSTPGQCLDGHWHGRNTAAVLASRVRRQAQGRRVEHKGGRGRFDFEFDADTSTVRIRARGIAHQFETTLANVGVHYRVKVWGQTEAPYRLEGETLVIGEPTKRMHAAQTVTFRAHANVTETRGLSVPVRGKYTVDCEDQTLRLRGDGPALRLARPAS